MQRVLVQEGLTLSSPGAQVQLSFAKRQALPGSAARLGAVGSEEKNQAVEQKQQSSNRDEMFLLERAARAGTGTVP